jgi:hypothetical protein
MRRVIFFISLILLANPAFASYLYYRSITVQASQVNNNAGSLTQFPILVCGNSVSGACTTSIPGLKQSGAGAHVANSNGYDIVFGTDKACQNLLTWEMENYVASTGEFEAWVTNTSTPLSGTANTTFYMCYGNSAISSFQSTASSVWDSNYVAVWHLGEATNAQASDSTINGNNSTSASATQSAGQIAKGQTFVSASNNLIGTPSVLGGAIQATLSTWYKRTATSNNIGISGNVNDRPILFIQQATNTFVGYNGASNTYAYYAGPNDTNWHYASSVLDTTQGTAQTQELLYIDGVKQTLAYGGGLLPGTLTGGGMEMGIDWNNGVYSDGSLNEVRVSNTARSAGWIATEYNNQSSPSGFYTMGSEVGGPYSSTIQGTSTIMGTSSIN